MHRKTFELVLVSVCSIIFLTGCTYNEAATVKPKPWVSNQVVQPTNLPDAVVQFVDNAGGKVGDAKPRIIYAKTDIDDATLKPMYHITITGTFEYGSHYASELSMIVLADGSAGAFTDANDNTFNKIHL